MRWVTGVTALVLLAVGTVRAQGTTENPLAAMPDSLSQAHMLHVSPHLVIFDAKTKLATLEFRNPGPQPVEADIVVEDAYLNWSHGLPLDTTLFTEHRETLEPRDTVVVTPGPKDQYAGQWLAGLPPYVRLKPHETQRITMRINPPAHLPDGEYWARIVAIVRPMDRKHGQGHDTRTVYTMPIKGGLAPPMLRDSVQVFYRQGHVTMGLAAAGPGLARQDVENRYARIADWDHALWIRVPLHLAGTAHFEGLLHVTYHNVATGAERPLDPWAITVYRDGVLHGWAATDDLSPGRYLLIFTFTSPQEDVPPAKRLPLMAAPITIPFEVQ